MVSAKKIKKRYHIHCHILIDLNTTHIYLWSMPLEPRIIDSWDEKFKNYHVYPLTYSSIVAVRQLLCRSKWSDSSDLLSAQEREACFHAGQNYSDRLIGVLRKSKVSWVSSADHLQLALSFFQYFLWRDLIRAGRVKYGEGPVIHYPVFSNASIPTSIRRSIDMFKLASDEANGWSHPTKKERIYNAVDLVLSKAAYLFLKHPRLMLGYEGPKPLFSGCDLIMLAQQEADRWIQAPLVSRLNNKHSVRIGWIRCSESSLKKSPDEIQINKVSASSDEVVIPPDLREYSRWRLRIFKKFSDAFLAIEYKRGIRSISDTISKSTSFRLANLLSRQHEHIRLFRSVEGLLSKAEPRCLAINSSYSDMLTPQIWAERRNIPLIRLPHGMEDTLGQTMQWNGKYIGVFGRRAAQDLAGLLNSSKSTIAKIGSLHIGKMAMDIAGQRELLNFDQNFKVLLPVSPGAFHFPDSPLQIEQDIEAITSAVNRAGGVLIVRGHPRQASGNWSDFSLKKRILSNQDWLLSDGSQASLTEQINSSTVIVVRMLGGAAVQCLYSKRPVVAWLPRTGLKFSDTILRDLPANVRSESELFDVIERLKKDEVYLRGVLNTQSEILREIIENPFGEPYDLAESFILKSLGKN